MLRQELARKGLVGDPDFEWRGEGVSRIEGFSDAVFAFSITLLVVSLEVPTNFSELAQTMRGFLAFAICFTMLIWIWYSHYIFFRRFGMQNAYTIVLNSILLFVVLFYIYPLKFLFTFLMNEFLGFDDTAAGEVIGSSDTPTLMIIYSLGFLAIFAVFFLLYLHAYRKREVLELNAIELHYTKMEISAHVIHMSIAIVSILISIIGGRSWAAVSGLIYSLIGPARGIHGYIYGRKIPELKKSGIEE